MPHEALLKYALGQHGFKARMLWGFPCFGRYRSEAPEEIVRDIGNLYCITEYRVDVFKSQLVL